MTLRIALAHIALLACCSVGVADPMKCTGEYNVCMANCVKVIGATFPSCKTNCRDRQKACLLSGCWNTGMKTYCGLQKQ